MLKTLLKSKKSHAVLLLSLGVFLIFTYLKSLVSKDYEGTYVVRVSNSSITYYLPFHVVRQILIRGSQFYSKEVLIHSIEQNQQKGYNLIASHKDSSDLKLFEIIENGYKAFISSLIRKENLLTDDSIDNDFNIISALYKQIPSRPKQTEHLKSLFFFPDNLFKSGVLLSDIYRVQQVVSNLFKAQLIRAYLPESRVVNEIIERNKNILDQIQKSNKVLSEVPIFFPRSHNGKEKPYKEINTRFEYSPQSSQEVTVKNNILLLFLIFCFSYVVVEFIISFKRKKES